MLTKAPRGTKDITQKMHINGIMLKINLEKYVHYLVMKR